MSTSPLRTPWAVLAALTFTLGCCAGKTPPPETAPTEHTEQTAEQAATPTPAETTQTPAAAPAEAQPKEPAQPTAPAIVEAEPEPRTLSPNATFAELVAAAQTPVSRGSSEACILRRADKTGPFRLEGDIAPSIRPLPAPGNDLAARVANDEGPVRVLSTIGQSGSGELTVATFTRAPVSSYDHVRVVIVTGNHSYLRRTDAPMAGRFSRPLNDKQVVAMLNRGKSATPRPVVVTASGDVKLTRLAQVMEQIDESPSAFVVLAVALPQGTELPSPPPAPKAAPLCPAGLPAPSMTEPTGHLDKTATDALIKAVSGVGRICIQVAKGRATLGGNMTIHARIAADGTIPLTCASTDTAQDPSLRECVLRGLRALQLTPPSPPGVVDVTVPVQLRPALEKPQPAVCH